MAQEDNVLSLQNDLMSETLSTEEARCKGSSYTTDYFY